MRVFFNNSAAEWRIAHREEQGSQKQHRYKRGGSLGWHWRKWEMPGFVMKAELAWVCTGWHQRHMNRTKQEFKSWRVWFVSHLPGKRSSCSSLKKLLCNRWIPSQKTTTVNTENSWSWGAQPQQGHLQHCSCTPDSGRTGGKSSLQSCLLETTGKLFSGCCNHMAAKSRPKQCQHQ